MKDRNEMSEDKKNMPERNPEIISDECTAFSFSFSK